MLITYIKSASRFIRNNKLFTGINMMGLSISLAVSFIILLFVINELSYDRYHKNSKHVFRVLNYHVDLKNIMSGTPYPLATALKEEFPQIEKAARVRYAKGFSLKVKEEWIKVNDALGTTSDIFDIFTLPVINGSLENNLLDEPNSIVLSRSLAEVVYPGQNPLGQEIIGLINDTEQVFIVKGIFEDLPENSTFRTSCLLNSKWTLEPINTTFKISDADVNWTKNFWVTWVRLSKDCNVKSLEDQFRSFELRNMGETPSFQYSLQNLRDVYLKSTNVTNSGFSGNIRNVKLFSAIAFLILLVAAINYIILSTAVSTGRRLEIGIRKTFGASTGSVRNQLLSESILLALIVFPISIFLMKISLPFAGELFETKLNIISSNIPIYLVVFFALIFTIGIISGLYSSSYLSRLKVVSIFKNSVHTGNRKQFFRSFLIVVQLVIFCSFVSSTLIIRSQYKYALNKDLGYYNKDIVFVELGRGFKDYSSYISSIKSSPNIIMAGGVMGQLPMEGFMSMMAPHFEDKTLNVKMEGLSVDWGFIQTMGIKILKGRDFSHDFGTDLKQSLLLNETAVKQLGIIDPIGKKLFGSTIIGIVKDFNLHSIHSDIPPLFIKLTDKYIRQVAVHYKSGTLPNILPMLETELKKVAPDKSFRYSPIELMIKKIYSSERNLSTIVSTFALFALLIAAFGLFGLTLFIARSRIKEIAIKKVFGVSESTIVNSFLSYNLILVIAGNLISIPVTIHFMTQWLNNYPYKKSIDWRIFLFSFVIAAFVVLLTVFIHSYKASRTNPVKALKHN